MKKTYKKEKIKTIAYSLCALSLCSATLVGFWYSNKDNDKATPIESATELLTEAKTENHFPVNDKVQNIVDDRTVQTTEESIKEIYFSQPLSNGIIKEFSKGELVKNATTDDWRTHSGADYKGVLGDPVKAICKGTVTETKEDALWGMTVTIDHGNGITAVYKGLKKDSVLPIGTKVKANDKIGDLGEIPIEKADGPHLHLEILKNGEAVSPKDYTGKKVQF